MTLKVKTNKMIGQTIQMLNEHNRQKVTFGLNNIQNGIQGMWKKKKRQLFCSVVSLLLCDSRGIMGSLVILFYLEGLRDVGRTGWGNIWLFRAWIFVCCDV